MYKITASILLALHVSYCNKDRFGSNDNKDVPADGLKAKNRPANTQNTNADTESPNRPKEVVAGDSLTTAKSNIDSNNPIVIGEASNNEIAEKPNLPKSSSSAPLTKTFDVKLYNLKVDMVWILDTSGSMTDKIAKVSANMAQLINNLAKSKDIKLAVIAQSGATGFDLAPSIVAQGHVQIANQVHSDNALANAAAAGCPAADTVITTGASKVCNIPAAAGLDPVDVLPSGKLLSFFRPDAVKVFVVVTDDDAIGVDSSNFLKMVQSAKKEPVSVFSFSGLSTSATCTISAPGLQYEKLAKATGGRNFDLCAPDWTANFKLLSEKIVAIAEIDYQLPSATKSIVEVSIDQVLIKPSQYTLLGNLLEFQQGVVSPTSKTITVVYKE